MKITKEDNYYLKEDDNYNLIRVKTEKCKEAEIKKSKEEKIKEIKKQLKRRDTIDRITSTKIFKILIIILNIIAFLFFASMCRGANIWSQYPDF